jgi:hypothetical protein
MTEEEKIALKVACIRAAATLLADPERRAVDPAACADIAWRLFHHVTKIEWEKRP